MKYILDFLKELRGNNNKEWFDAHKNEYKVVQEKVEILTKQLIGKIGQWDPDIRVLQPKDCLYRINRDLRFSKDKSLYKNHIGIFLGKGGKRGGYGGYYFHIEPEMNNENGHHLLAAGTYMLENKYLKVIREDIQSEYNKFYSIIRQANLFTLDRSNSLKQVPHGFPRGTKCDKFLTLKDFCLIRPIDEKMLFDCGGLMHQNEKIIEDGDLSSFLSKEFHRTRNFIAFVNRAIDFVKEQDEEDLLETW